MPKEGAIRREGLQKQRAMGRLLNVISFLYLLGSWTSHMNDCQMLSMFIFWTLCLNLQAYLYRSGFARFTNTRFSMKKEDIINNFVHLTNFSIQKHAPTYDSKNGTKWPLYNLKLHMITKHGEKAVHDLFHQIEELITRSLLAVQNVIIQDKHCFELYGYDILVDQLMKPWLLEVNASPSLAADTPSDYALKYGMLEDLLTVVDMERHLTSHVSLKQVGGFDLLIEQGKEDSKWRPSQPLLGCFNDRVEQLRRLYKGQS